MSLADDLAELDRAEQHDQGDQGDQDENGEDQPANLYASVHEFVTDFIAQIYAHPVADRQTSWRWCSHWHHHAEAVARLEAAWKAFEALR